MTLNHYRYIKSWYEKLGANIKKKVERYCVGATQCLDLFVQFQASQVVRRHLRLVEPLEHLLDFSKSHTLVDIVEQRKSCCSVCIHHHVSGNKAMLS